MSKNAASPALPHARSPSATGCAPDTQKDAQALSPGAGALRALLSRMDEKERLFAAAVALDADAMDDAQWAVMQEAQKSLAESHAVALALDAEKLLNGRDDARIAEVAKALSAPGERGRAAAERFERSFGEWLALLPSLAERPEIEGVAKRRGESVEQSLEALRWRWVDQLVFQALPLGETARNTLRPHAQASFERSARSAAERGRVLGIRYAGKLAGVFGGEGLLDEGSPGELGAKIGAMARALPKEDDPGLREWASKQALGEAIENGRDAMRFTLGVFEGWGVEPSDSALVWAIGTNEGCAERAQKLAEWGALPVGAAERLAGRPSLDARVRAILEACALKAAANGRGAAAAPSEGARNAQQPGGDDPSVARRAALRV
jgi:hypothetical protein